MRKELAKEVPRFREETRRWLRTGVDVANGAKDLL